MIIDPDTVIQECQVTKYKANFREFKIFLGAKLPYNLTTKAVNIEWLEAMHGEKFGFTNVTPMEMLIHLCTAEGTLNFMDESDRLSK